MNIVFFSLEGVGHMNACIGIAQVLKDAGHRVQFIISEQWRGRIARYGKCDQLNLIFYLIILQRGPIENH